LSCSIACHTRCDNFWLTAGEELIVRETVAIETLARAATVRISGLLGTVVRLPFRLTQPCYFVFLQVPKNENSFGIGRVPASHDKISGSFRWRKTAASR
jgi:hypothetical protein